MITRKFIYLVLTAFMLTNCDINHNSQEKILSDIFPQLIDSLHIKWRPISPPPPPLFDKDSNFVGIDSIEMERIFSEYQKYLLRIDSIDTSTQIAIADSAYLIDWNRLKSKTYKKDSLISSIISLNEIDNGIPRKLGINHITIPDSFKLLSESEMEVKYSDIWLSRKDYKFAGILVFSKIYFSENSDFGLFEAEYYHAEIDGAYSYCIVIEKTNKRWRIRKLLPNWVP